MSDLRTNQKISERFDLEFVRRTRRAIRSRRVWTIVCAAASLMFLGFFAVSDDQTIYQSRTVSTAHQFCRNSCDACHNVPFQSLRLKMSDHEFVRDVEAKTCGNCHAQHALDHHATIVTEQSQSCFDCHKEHGETGELARVSNDYCVRCHGDLKLEHGDTIFSQQITSFDDHPEFPLVSLYSDEPAAAMYKGHSVEPVKSDAGWTWQDNPKFKFRHDKHLNPGVTLVIDDGGHGNDAHRRQLTCADCHAPDDSGRYMKPIRYESHCKKCHQLQVSNELNPLSPEGAIAEPLPHVKVELIRGQLRDRLMHFAQQNPQRVVKMLEERKAGDTTGEKLNPKTLKSPESEAHRNAVWAESKMKDFEGREWEWVDAEMLKIDNRSDKHSKSTIQNTCARCHEIEHPKKSDGEDGVPPAFTWTVAEPNMPTRWFPHSRFDHSTHTMIQCADCHYKATPQLRGKQDSDLEKTPITESISQADILLPSISTCRTCHGNRSRLKDGGQARADCVECHKYHHAHPDASEFELRDLDSFLHKHIKN